jgi:hypothetical protein
MLKLDYYTIDTAKHILKKHLAIAKGKHNAKIERIIIAKRYTSKTGRKHINKNSVKT